MKYVITIIICSALNECFGRWQRCTICEVLALSFSLPPLNFFFFPIFIVVFHTTCHFHFSLAGAHKHNHNLRATIPLTHNHDRRLRDFTFSLFPFRMRIQFLPHLLLWSTRPVALFGQQMKWGERETWKERQARESGWHRSIDRKVLVPLMIN